MNDDFRILTESERVRFAHLLRAGRIQTEIGLASDQKVSIEADPDGTPVVVTRTRIDLTMLFDGKPLSTSNPAKTTPDIETTRHAGGQSVKIGGARIDL